MGAALPVFLAAMAEPAASNKGTAASAYMMVVAPEVSLENRIASLAVMRERLMMFLLFQFGTRGRE